jgi:hypothetical protein
MEAGFRRRLSRGASGVFFRRYGFGVVVLARAHQIVIGILLGVSAQQDCEGRKHEA